MKVRSDLPNWKPRAALARAQAVLHAAGLRADDHRSQRGVPIIILRGSTGTSDFVSLCWFRRTRVFRLFVTVEQGRQDKTDFADLDELVAGARGVLSC